MTMGFLFLHGCKFRLAFIKMQLDFDVSPSANIMTLRLTLSHVTYDFDPHDP